MPLFQPVRMAKRPPRIGKEAVVSPWRGLLRVSRWPRKRGQPSDPRQQARLRMFALIQRATKLLSEGETRYMREAIRQHNKNHAGQRGSAAIRQRDWHHQRISGRGFAFDTPEGIVSYPAGVSRTASHILDHLEPEPGDLAARQSDQWRTLPPPVTPCYLAVDDTGADLEWLPFPDPAE